MGRFAKRGAINSALELLGIVLISIAILIILYFAVSGQLSKLFISEFK
jgi:hypothetical protein